MAAGANTGSFPGHTEVRPGRSLLFLGFLLEGYILFIV